MIATPPDYSWLADDAGDGSYDFTYVRGLTPEQLVTRLGGRPDTFTPGGRHGPAWRTPPASGMTIGVTAVGDWAFVLGDGSFGITEEIVMPLSAGTRLVSQFLLGVKGIDYFYWIEDGEIRFYFIAQEGYPDEVPEELVKTMNEIDSLYRPFAYPCEGPSFLLSERLTGITLTEQLVMESTYLWGVVPEPQSRDIPDPWRG
ncbi:DUF6461 domain-containing protein [Nonomuraea sp. NPDC059194]|uniref:DUF6461 domain-containing protein n=1 Tax=Nonomuraea sp. NPDC059194 TaxID=3346764 RepID=UPI0036972F51